jgi:ADP-ribosylglycohydrolase
MGDAWAMPALMTPDQTWEQYGGWVDTFLPGPIDHIVHSGFHPARITDDTEQAFALLQSILKHGALTLDGVVEALIGWYDRIGGDTSPYVGPSTRRGVQALKRGLDPHTTGIHGDTNGAAMRVSVIGLLHPGDVDAAIDDALISAIPTHNTDIGFSGAAAIAGAVAAAMTADTLDTIIEAGIRAADIGRQRGRRWFGASISQRITMAVHIARQDSDPRTRIQALYDVIGSTLSMTESVPSAFGVLALANGDPRQTAIYAAALSGDADTVGAMACAIAGAWKGASAIPAPIVAALKAANPDYDVEDMAAGLLRQILRLRDGTG